MIAGGPQIDIADHVEVVVVDVDDFHGVFIFQGVRDRPTDNLLFGKVDRAFVMGMVQLSRSNQRNDSRRINVISNLFSDNRDIVTLRFVQERKAALNGTWHAQAPTRLRRHWEDPMRLQDHPRSMVPGLEHDHIALEREICLPGSSGNRAKQESEYSKFPESVQWN